MHSLPYAGFAASSLRSSWQLISAFLGLCTTPDVCLVIAATSSGYSLINDNTRQDKRGRKGNQNKRKEKERKEKRRKEK